MTYVYILKSLKDSHKYIGSTKNLRNRLKQHQQGKVTSTKNRRPLILWGYQQFSTIQEAATFEKKYKRSHELLERMIKLGRLRVINHGA